MDHESEILRLREELDHRQREIDAMRRTADALFALPSAEEMLKETLAVAIEVLRADGGSILVYNQEKQALIFRYVLGPGADKLIGYELPVSRGVAGRVFRTRQPARVDNLSDLAEHHSLDERTGYLVDSMMSAPLKRAGRVPVGVINVVNARHSFDDRDLEVLEVLAAVAAAAIENARLAQEARKVEIVHLIGNISHDTKNILTPIQTGAQTLQPMLDDMVANLDKLCSECPEGEPWGKRIAQSLSVLREDYAWILQATIEASVRIQNYVGDLANAVKGEIAAPNFQKAQVNDTAREVAKLLRIVADKAQVELRLELDEKLPFAELDAKQIYNALYNLVNNAIPETPPGGSVTLRSSLVEDKILIEVADTGGGIPEHVRAKLFTDEAISTKPGGTGLGTRIIAGVVARHGGTIEVQSEIGQGSIFSIRLPLEQTCAN